jgi:predicted AAA+ superfamily ATPase
MYPRLCKPLKNRSFFLFGARSTGKTKLLETLFAGDRVLWIDLLKRGEALTFSRNPRELEERLDARREPPEWVVIDEVQRMPQLLDDAHRFIEERGLKFALTGSSARKLKRGAANLLAGRALVNHLYPLTYRELGGDFALADVFAWGSLPLLALEKDALVRTELLKSYVDVYLREEIREEQIVRRLDPFARFLEAAAQSSGAIVNLTRIGREAGTDAKSISRYFQILEDTLLGFFLEPYHRSIRKRQRQQAKFFLFDLGVRRALEGTLQHSPRPGTYEWGRCFEEYVVLEAIRLNAYRRTDFHFSYLRTQSQLEVDLIAERRGSRTWVIEIKAASTPDPSEIRKLVELAASVPRARPAFFCSAEHARIVEGIEILPWREGLELMFFESSALQN